MSVILQAWYRSAYNATVPAPVDAHTSDEPWWWDKLSSQANFIASCGFDAILLPSVSKTTAGSYTGADGYGIFDPYDLGSKIQFFSRATRFGHIEELLRAMAIFKANGINSYADLVLHQCMGGRAGVYRYLGADGKTLNGRYPKNPGCFVGDTSKGYVNRDPIAGPISDDFSFGDELAYKNCNPPGYTITQAINHGDWLTRYLGIEGYRIDDTKGLNTAFVHQFLTSKAMSNKFAVGEYYDGNADTLNWWIWQSGMQGRANTFDFHFHFAVQSMCNNNSRWDMRQLYNVVQTSAQDHKVKFVENPDTDTDGFATVVWNKAQGYFLGATTEGDLMVYYKDWAKDAGCYGWGLQEFINNYIWINKHLANGGTTIRFADYQSFVFERTGAPGLLCGINNDQYNGWRNIWVQTNFGANVQLHDYTGHANDAWTNQDGWVELWLPPNINGLGTVAFSRVGQDHGNYTNSYKIAQEFTGAADLSLDIMPFTNDLATNIGRVWGAVGQPIWFEITTDRSDWTADSAVYFSLALVNGVNSTVVDLRELYSDITLQSPATLKFSYTPSSTGYLMFYARGSNLPHAASFTCKVTYQAPQNLATNDFRQITDAEKPSVPLTDTSYSVHLRNLTIAARLTSPTVAS